MSFSPVKNPTTPPVFGMVAAISAIALPAIDAFVTASASRPCTATENAIIASPNGTSCSPNSDISFSPAKNPTTPPLFGRVAAISANVFPAVAALATTFASIPAIATEKSFIALPNGTSSVANSDRDEPPVIHDVNPCKTSAAVKIRIVSASAFTPSIIDASI